MALTWYRVFESEAAAQAGIPQGTARLVLVKGRRICLAHSQAGFFAIQDACPHLAEPLSKGSINAMNEIICPLHQYRYHLATGTECDNKTKGAKTYPLKWKAGALYLGVAAAT